jgi:hypothetical protein
MCVFRRGLLGKERGGGKEKIEQRKQKQKRRINLSKAHTGTNEEGNGAGVCVTKTGRAINFRQKSKCHWPARFLWRPDRLTFLILIRTDRAE